MSCGAAESADGARLKRSDTLYRIVVMRTAVRRLAALAAPLLACAPEVTFTKDIAPILQAKCQSCHRPGQIAPMSLLTYQEARPYAHAIRMSVAIGNMPPFYAAGPPGYFKDDIRLTEKEKQLLADWANADAPEGDPALLPAPIAWDDSEWPLGEPDLVLHFPRHSPRPNYKDQYVTLVSDQALAEDTWVRALHLKTQSKQVIHHSTLFLWDPATEMPEGGMSLEHINPKENPLFTWFPGFLADPLPPGQAILLPKGWRVAGRTHFAPTRTRVSEEMALGIYHADGPIDSVQKNIAVFIGDLRIPPGKSDYTRTERMEFPEDAQLSHFRVHMHLRGKSAKFILNYPDGSKREIFDLLRYRFAWQRYYYLAEPLTVPKGTVAEFVGVWDNSAANPQNPDPTMWCFTGRRTIDEMFGATIFYTPLAKLAIPLRIEKGRRVDGSGPMGQERGSSQLL